MLNNELSEMTKTSACQGSHTSVSNNMQEPGYVTIDEKQQKALFYYFVEAETEAASKPLVLWLNGGKTYINLH
jgi:carboxypeptidase C (cathepsin A)